MDDRKGRGDEVMSWIVCPWIESSGGVCDMLMEFLVS